MSSTTASSTIGTLRSLFARHGLPQVIVSDNGPQFTSDDFKKFMQINGVKHITSAPYHPQSNGLAERFVQTFKLSYKAGGGAGEQRIDRFLLKYRTTVHSSTGHTPSELMYGHTVRTRLDLLKPSEPAALLQEPSHNRITVGSLVWYQDYRLQSRNWLPGIIMSAIRNNMFWIKDALNSNQTVRRHNDQLHPRTTLPYVRLAEKLSP